MSMFQVLQDSSTEKITVVFDSRPASCTVVLYKSTGSELTASGNATLGMTGLVASSSGSGQDNAGLLHVADAYLSDLAFLETYRVVNTAGQYEYIKLLSVPTDGYCEVDTDLLFSYEANDTIESCVVSRTLTAEETATLDVNYRAKFTATMSDSTVVVKDVVYDVVKHKLEQQIRPDNIHEYDPMLVNLLPDNWRGTEWKLALERSWKALYQNIVNLGIRPSLIITDQQLAEAQLALFKAQLAENGIKMAAEEYPYQSARYFRKQADEILAQTAQNIQWYDSTEDMAYSADENNPVKRGRFV